MPPRTPACRGAAQYNIFRHAQPVWITDEVLADAFHRFLNVSNASRKRYGSNVPGPLEARRRASKRRIMGLAAASPGIGPGIGALFGPDKSLHQAWSWEPPKGTEQRLSREQPTPSDLPQWLSNYNVSTEEKQPRILDPVQEYRLRLARVRDVNGVEALWSDIGVEPEHMHLFSQMANTHFLDNLGTRGMGYPALFGFLRNPKLNVSEAKNIKTFIHAVIKKGMPIGCLGELVNRIRDSLKLGAMLPSELDDIVDNIPKLCRKVCRQPDVTNDWEFGAYWAIWRGLTSCKIIPLDHFDTSVVRKMVERLLVLETPPEIQDIAKLQKLRSTGHTNAALFRLEIYRHLWPTADSAKPDDFAAHFAFWARLLAKSNISDSASTSDGLQWLVIRSVVDSMSIEKAQEVMAETTALLLPAKSSMDEETQKALQLWFSCVSKTCHLQNPTTKQIEIFARCPEVTSRMDPTLAVPYLKRFYPHEICQLWMHYWMPQYIAKDKSVKNFKLSRQQLQRGFKKRMKHPDKPQDPRITQFFVAILTLKDEKLPYKTALPKVMELISALYGPDMAHDLYKRFLVFEQLQIPDPHVVAAVMEAACENYPQQALKYFKANNNVWLSLCPRLPLALIEHGILPRDELFCLLDHNDPLDRVPPEHRENFRNRLSALRIDLVHLIAHAYATQTAFPHRHRFRNVYFCYLWLRDHGASLGPLLSKALVRTAVTGPLENHEWVSTNKLRWVLGLVRQIEGAEVAAQLDHLVWRWRGDVIMQARRRWDQAGLFRRVGPSTVTMARRAGLFDHDAPRWTRWYRKMTMNAGFFAPKCVRRPRFQGAQKGAKKVWGRLDRRCGGKNGWRRPYSPWKWQPTY
ncbi:Fungal specific transcription factor domain containing protein [Lasiodiplodia theobromae]|uniref:Fungal specific transcription factor domain containing protein n=1 Tax=Lasiodiplodia theobromae TaxID=45133 RepID=UPI0015C3B5A6|nr:Fungal specific transcription factor domain containing protein [Lasiodiplodia theobromae]KAF4533909.1 Fungal specific transcription factor domain containing protein [Lasiodiplodia theobromae]